MPLLPIINIAIVLLGRFFIKIFITVFGWAIVIFFGKLPENKKAKFYIMIILSSIWMVVLIAYIHPAVTRIFNGYLPDESMTKKIIGFLCTFGIIVLPTVVGVLGLLLNNTSWKNPFKVIWGIIKGYYFSIYLGISMAFMLVLAPTVTLKRILLKEDAVHMPMCIPDGWQLIAMSEIKKALGNAGIEVEEKISSKIYSLPVIFLRKIIMELLGAVTDRNICLKGDNIAIYLNPMDIMIEGKDDICERVRILIADAFAYSKISLTWGQEAKDLEIGSYDVYMNVMDGKISEADAMGKFEEMKIECSKSQLEYLEWEIITRQLQEFENEVLKKIAKTY